MSHLKKPSRPSNNQGRNRQVAHKGRAQYKPTAVVATGYDAQGHRITAQPAPSSFLEAGGVKKAAARQAARGRNYGGYGGYRHQAGPTRLW